MHIFYIFTKASDQVPFKFCLTPGKQFWSPWLGLWVRLQQPLKQPGNCDHFKTKGDESSATKS